MNNYRLTPLQNTAKSKNRIMRNVQQQLQKPVVHQQRWKPVIVSIVLLFIIVAVSVPLIKQAFQNDAVTIEKVIIPEAPYANLIMSTYIEESKEVIYQVKNTINTYNVDTNTIEKLVSIEEGIISEVKANHTWLVWGELHEGQELVYVMNRKTNEKKQLDIKNYADFLLIDDHLMLLTNVNSGDTTTIGYVRYNIQSDELQVVHSLEGSGNFRAVIEGETLVIAEEIFVNGKQQSVITVYHLASMEKEATFVIPYNSIQRLQLQESELFMMYRMDEKEILGVLNINTEQFQPLTINAEVHDFATDGETFAISIKKGDSDHIQFYKRNGDTLSMLSTLPSIKERLVRPRLEGQTFVMNGEGESLPIYLMTVQ